MREKEEREEWEKKEKTLTPALSHKVGEGGREETGWKPIPPEGCPAGSGGCYSWV